MAYVNPQQKALQDTLASPAQVGFLPSHSGDGYGYGGGAILTIGSVAIPLGEGYEAREIAKEMAARWNAARLLKHEADGGAL